MRKSLLTFSLVLLLSACNTVSETPAEVPYGDDGLDPVEDSTGVQKLRTSNTVPTETGEFTFGNDMLQDVALLDGDTLLLNVGYSGCAAVDFELTWDGSLTEEGEAALTLSRDVVDGMTCQMYIGNTLKFDLTPLKDAYLEEFDGEELKLSVYKAGEEEEAVNLLYSF